MFETKRKFFIKKEQIKKFSLLLLEDLKIYEILSFLK